MEGEFSKKMNKYYASILLFFTLILILCGKN